MRWLIYIVAVIVLLIAVVVAIGYALPTAHIATRQAHYRQSPEAVYALISGPQNWRPDLVRTEELPKSPSGARRWKEYAKNGAAVTFEVAQALPPRIYQARIADKSLPFGGTWTYEITPTANGCDLRIIEAGEVYNPVFRFVSRFLMGYTKTMDTYLVAVGGKFGELVTPQP
jgi:Polyketide cyclase / dehydrase and lipid transport